jgi:hypothetical protein
MKSEVPFLKLQEDIHTALKLWHDVSGNIGPLDYLQLFRQARLGGIVNVRRATNQILLDAFETLALDHEDSANLLRQHFLDGMLMQVIANRLNIGQSTLYRKQQEALQQLALIIQTKEEQARKMGQASLEKRLRLPPETLLFGVEERLNSLLERLLSTNVPWLVSIEGLGGIGKTALANAIVRRLELTSRFHDTAWVSAKPQDFFPGIGLEEKTAPALTVDMLIDALLEQLGQAASLAQSPQEKRVALIQLLKQASYLIVIDNLETIADYQALLPLLWEITNPSKVLLTSRHSLRAYPNIFCHTLAALNQVETFNLIRYEAGMRGLLMLAEAIEAQLQPIYQVVGGNPLALKLVVGQTAFLPLAQVLDNLKAAYGKNISDLYTHIYWQAWYMLDNAGQQTLLIMPLAQEGTLKQLLALSRLESAQLHQALQQLATLSLVQVEGGLDERRYSIHRLTETFLLNEAITWRSSA